MAAPQVEPTTTDTGDDGEMVHAFCCNEDLGLCGADLTGAVVGEIAPDDVICQVCLIAARERMPCAAPNCPNWGDW